MEGSELSLRLDEQTRAALEAIAQIQECRIEDIVLAAIRRTIKSEQKPLRKTRAGASARAPLDDFLPEGADPFAPVPLEGQVSRSGASSFADVQTRMRFAGTPSLLKDYLPDDPQGY